MPTLCFRCAVPLLSIALAIATSRCASAASLPWWHNSWSHRYTATAPRDAQGSFLVTIEAPEADAGGADLRVLNTSNQDVPWRLLHRGSDKRFVIEIALPDPATLLPGEPPPKFLIYYGNAKPAPFTATGTWTSPAVTVEVRLLVEGQHPENWEELQYLLERTRREGGHVFVRQISPDSTGFDRSRPQLNIYRAHLLCEDDGDYEFFVDSLGPSFLLLDDQLLVANGGDPHWGRPKSSGSVRLSAGAHRLELYHACLIPNAPLNLSWITPRTKPQRHTVPADALVIPFRGVLTAREKLGEPLNPFFTYTQRTAIRINELADEFVSIQFADTTVATDGVIARQWDFGDGQTSSAQNPLHTYRGTAPRTVTLTVTDSKGRTARCQRQIEIGRTYPVPARVTLELERLPLVLTPETKLVFSATVANLRKREMELTLRWQTTRRTAPTTAAERPAGAQTNRRTEVQETAMKLGPEDDRAVEIRTGTVGSLASLDIMLLYCGVVVAQKTVSFLPPDMVRGVLKASGGQLYDADGARVVLVADPYAKLQSESPGFPKNIVCIDDSLLGNAVVMDGGDSFARILESILNSAAQGKTAASAITVRHIPWFAEDKPQNEVTAVYRLARLPAVDLEADSLVILSIGLPDLHDRLSAVDYEKHLQFIVDYLWCVRRAQVLLVTLPPVPADAEMSRAFAKKTVQVGLEKGVPVFDLYTAMRVRPDWRDFFRDTDTQQGAFFLYPNRRGQHWIAEELARLILQWKTRPATGS